MAHAEDGILVDTEYVTYNLHIVSINFDNILVKIYEEE